MASDRRPPAHSLSWQESLEATPYKHGFLATLRRLDALHPELPRLGQAKRPADEPVRLGQEPSMAFAPSTLARVEPGSAERPPQVRSYFFGLLGPNGPLPLHLTEYTYDRIRHHRDPTLARFLDLFHHRLLLLFYRSWASAAPEASFDRPADDRFMDYLGSLIGIGSPALRGRDEFPDLAKLYYAGRLAPHVKNAEGLECVLTDLLKVPVAIEEFVGGWLDLPVEDHCRLGSRTTARLGRTTVAGARVWSVQNKFRIRIGPLQLDAFQHLLPGAAGARLLRDVVRQYCGDEYLCEANLILCSGAVPPLQLGRGARLGQTSWAYCTPPAHDVADVFFDLRNAH